jgi:hypothetical protein
LVPMANINNRTRHTAVVGLLQDRKYACVTDDIVREMNTKHIYFFHEHSHEKKTSNLINISRCVSSHFVTLSVCRETGASFSQSNFFRQIQNSEFANFGLKLTCLRCFKAIFLRIYSSCHSMKNLVKVPKFRKFFSLRMWKIASFT